MPMPNFGYEGKSRLFSELSKEQGAQLLLVTPGLSQFVLRHGCANADAWPV